MGDDERWMRRALDLAAEPASPSPNPRVGAVIVAGERLVGEGAHAGVGSSHAEPLALAAAGNAARGATLYVTLEPCVHTGRTPPCTPQVVAAGVRRVVVGLEDPDERVSGQGVAQLRAAGIDVVTGVEHAACERQNASYLKHRRTGRPLVRMKLAMSLDGRLAAPDGSSQWISGSAARARSHRLRARADAVIVGSSTVGVDDPRLTVREGEVARQPLRVVLDSSGRTSPAAALFAEEGGVVVATTEAAPPQRRAEWEAAGAKVWVLPGSERGIDLNALLDALGDHDVLEVLVEGGGEVATSFLAGALVDALELHVGPVMLGRGGPEIGDLNVRSMGDGRRWAIRAVEHLDDTVVLALEPELAAEEKI